MFEDEMEQAESEYDEARNPAYDNGEADYLLDSDAIAGAYEGE